MKTIHEGLFTGLSLSMLRTLIAKPDGKLSDQIIGFTKDQDARIQEIAADVIDMLHQFPQPDDVDFSLELLNDAAPIIRKLGVISLSAFKHRRSPRIKELSQRIIDGLIEALDDPDLHVVEIALIGISMFKSRVPRRAVVKIMRHNPREHIRETAAWALKAMKKI